MGQIIKKENIQYPLSKNFFKFREFNDYHIKALLNNQLWFSTGNCFNDPFDCSINQPMVWASKDSLLEYVLHKRDTVDYLLSQGHTNNDVARFIEKMVTKIIENPEFVYDKSCDELRSVLLGNLLRSLVLCLCQNVTNNLMWSHYAAYHTGFCIEFNRKKLLSAQYLHHHAEVNYSNQPYNIVSNLKPKGQKHIHPAKQILFRKSPEWSYEKEYRLIHKELCPDSETKYKIFESYDPSCVESIYFGMKAKQSDIEELCKKLEGRDISFYKMSPESTRTTYDMEIIKLNKHGHMDPSSKFPQKDP